MLIVRLAQQRSESKIRARGSHWHYCTNLGHRLLLKDKVLMYFRVRLVQNIDIKKANYDRDVD